MSGQSDWRLRRRTLAIRIGMAALLPALSTVPAGARSAYWRTGPSDRDPNDPPETWRRCGDSDPSDPYRDATRCVPERCPGMDSDPSDPGKSCAPTGCQDSDPADPVNNGRRCAPARKR